MLGVAVACGAVKTESTVTVTALELTEAPSLSFTSAIKDQDPKVVVTSVVNANPDEVPPVMGR